MSMLPLQIHSNSNHNPGDVCVCECVCLHTCTYKLTRWSLIYIKMYRDKHSVKTLYNKKLKPLHYQKKKKPHCEAMQIKKVWYWHNKALTGVAQLAGCRPSKQRVTGWFQVRAHAWLQIWSLVEATDGYFSSSLSPSLPLSLKINK